MNQVIIKVLASALTLCCFQISSYSQEVDPLTGQLQMSIPLWTVNSGDLSAPISVYYSSGGGVKVNSPDSPTGMGWYLSNGSGGVYRDLRGLPDDFVGALSGVPSDLRNGWLHGNNARQVANFVPTALHDLSSCDGEVNDWNTLSGFNYSVDTEPDVFAFSAPGLNGKFLFDKNKNVVLMPYQDVNIQITRQQADSLITQIVITTNQGIKYTFQAGDKVVRHTMKASSYSTQNYFSTNYYYFKNNATYYSSWNLTEIRSPKGGVLTYNYSGTTESNSPDFITVINNTTGAQDTIYSDNYITTSVQLMSVTGSNEKATFVYGWSTIQSVNVTDLTYGSLLKNFKFGYSSVKGSATTPRGEPIRRNFLASLTEQINCNAFPGYSFSYYGVTINPSNDYLSYTNIPFSSGKGQDIFGYYDSTATSLSPELYVTSPDGANGERFRIAPAPANGYSLLTSGGGRSVNTNKVFYGALKTIKLPTGGTAMVVYEAADYYDALTNSTILGGGIRVKKIIGQVNDPTAPVNTYSYRLKSGLSSGQWAYRPVFAFADGSNIVRVAKNLAPSENILYSRVEVSTTGKGRVVYEYQNSGTYAKTSDGDYQATMSLIARPDPNLHGGCPGYGNLRTGYFTFPYPTNTNYDFERGLPVRITYLTNDRTKVTSRKTYTYQRTTLPVTTVSGVQYELMGEIFQFGKYSLLANVNKTTMTETTRTFDQSDTTKYVDKAVTYTYNANQMLSQTSTTGSDNTNYVTTLKYAKDYPTSGTDTQSQMINALVAANRHGSLIESVSYANGAAIGGQLTLYSNIYSGSRILPSQQLTLGDPTGFAPSTITSGAFNYSGNYYTTAYIDDYSALGAPTIVRNQSRQTSSIVVGYNGTAPALEVSGARTDQIVYNDFEPTLATAMTYAGGGSLISTDSWSGNYVGYMNPPAVFQQTSVVRGAGNYYRFSCWAKASAGTNLSVQFYNGSSWVTNTVSYPNAGTTAGGWQYLEQRIDISSIPAGATFSFKLTSSGTISLDNVAFYPETATILAHVYDPMNGKTADLSARGNAAFREYDAYGRLRYVRNTDKDIVQINDYHYQSPTGVSPSSQFTFNAQIATGQSVTFTGDVSCVPNVTYTWYVDDVQKGTSSNLTYTFTQNKDYHVRFVASSPNNGSSSTQVTIHPMPSITATVTQMVNGFQPTCRDSLSHRTFTANVTGNLEPSSVTYDWWISDNSSYPPPLQHLTTTTNTVSITLTANYTHTVTCYINATSLNLTNNNHDPVASTGVLNYTWQVSDCNGRP